MPEHHGKCCGSVRLGFFREPRLAHAFLAYSSEASIWRCRGVPHDCTVTGACEQSTSLVRFAYPRERRLSVLVERLP